MIILKLMLRYDKLWNRNFDKRIARLPRRDQRLDEKIRWQFHQRFFARFFRTNVLFGSFSNYVLALVPKFRTKNARVNVDEIDGRGRFQQYFMHSFYVCIS